MEWHEFRKRPVVIKAALVEEPMDIETLEGVMHAQPGDYLIEGVKGERYPCKPEVFALTYEPVGGSVFNKTGAPLDLTALGDRVILAPIKAASQTEGGVAVPDTANQDTPRGRVVSVGPGRQLRDGSRQPMGLNIGDVVLYERHGAVDVTIHGLHYVLLLVADIIAVVREASVGLNCENCSDLMGRPANVGEYATRCGRCPRRD